jgi:hypothetical protein
MRAITFQQRSWVIVILALALFIRAVIPAGFMVAPSSLKLTVQVCADGASGKTSVQIEVPLSKGGQRDKSDHGQKSEPCAFSALSMASMATDHSPLLIAALATIVATIITNGAPHLQHQTHYLRPPLRGPPSFASDILN